MLEILRVRKADRRGTELFTGIPALVDHVESDAAAGMQVARNGGRPRSDGHRSSSSDLMANIRDYRLAYTKREEAQRVAAGLNFEHERRKEQEHASAGSNPAKCRSESPILSIVRGGE